MVLVAVVDLVLTVVVVLVVDVVVIVAVFMLVVSGGVVCLLMWLWRCWLWC